MADSKTGSNGGQFACGVGPTTQDAYAAALARFSTAGAPRYVVPPIAGGIGIGPSQLLIETMEEMKLNHPKPYRDMRGSKTLQAVA
jgi:hypothetical protein